MKSKLKYIFLVLFCFILICGSAQTEKEKIIALNNRAQELINKDHAKSKIASEEALARSLKTNNDTLIYESRFNRGVANYYLDNKQAALEDFIANKTLAQKLNDDVKIIESLNALANMYKDLERYNSAMLSYKEALDHCEKKQIPSKKATVLSNIAMLYNMLDKPDSANYFNYKTLSLYKQNNSTDTLFLIHIYSCFSGNYSDLKIEDSVKKYSALAIDLAKTTGNTYAMAGNTYNLGDFYFSVKKYKEAARYLEEAFSLSASSDNLSFQYQVAAALANTYLELKNYENASVYYKMSLGFKEKVDAKETIDKISELEVKYETGKKVEELKRLSAEHEVNTLKVKQSKMLTAVSIISVIVFIIIAAILFKQNKNKQEANKLLHIQNKEITHQKKEITDSINYAKRIQLAILPPDKMVKRLLPDAFIFYKPKDVVSGDFYWVEEKNGLLMFAAVDCTGHGVPGAMMSVIGLNLLNRAVKEKDLTVPADILQHLDMGVTDTLRQNREDETINDGMDLSLCTFCPITKELQYAGAFNNLWVVRKNIATTHKLKSKSEVFFEHSLLEIKADKFPIGSNTDGVADSYTNHTVQLEKGDCVYLYSDGFADQFGGPKGKKFKYNALKKLLVSISALTPSEQKEELNKAYENWKGGLEQIDDILVIGVCI